MRFIRPRLSLVALAGLLAVTTACASASGLEETQAQVAALQQSVVTLTAELTAAQSRVSSLEEDLAGLQAGYLALGAGLRVDLDTAQSNVAELRDDLTTASSDLGALKNTFLLAQDQRDAQHESQRQADRLLLIHDLSNIALTVNDISAFDIAAVAVSDAIEEIGDTRLASAWDGISDEFHAWWDAPLDSLEEATAAEELRINMDTYLGILQQRLTAGVG
ncbi:MAG: hypothetical protein IIB33_05270 [Chloroflexi bacterium]|nr:hypothetical protein [Chloroflexota bacterium]